MSKPFDYINNLNYGGDNMMRESENDTLAEKLYNPWLSNLAFALYPDTILYANLMNQYSHLDNRPQYEFYKYALRPKKRKAKWVKNEDDEVIDMICDTFGCNGNVARQYISLLSPDQLEAINKNYNKGG